MSQSHAAMIEKANADLLVEGRAETADDYFTPDYVAHATETDLSAGPPAVRGYVAMLHKAFSDIDVNVEILVESGDRVAWQRTVRANHTGAFMGFPATNRTIVWRDMLTSRIADGRIAEEWVVTDQAERLLLARKG